MSQLAKFSPSGAITLVLLGPEWGLPTISPFGLKLATWMRLADVDFEVRVENDTRKGPKQKSPFIERDETAIGDSELIIEMLIAERGIDPDGHLDATQRALGLALRRTFEDHFNFAHMQNMFVEDHGWEHSRPHFDFLPAPIRPLVARLIRRAIRKEVWTQGLGRHTSEELNRMAAADLDAASTLLGEQPFFFGEQPTLTDCSIYAFLALTLWPPIDSPIKEHLARTATLVAFCERMRSRFWAEDLAIAA